MILNSLIMLKTPPDLGIGAQLCPLLQIDGDVRDTKTGNGLLPRTKFHPFLDLNVERLTVLLDRIPTGGWVIVHAEGSEYFMDFSGMFDGKWATKEQIFGSFIKMSSLLVLLKVIRPDVKVSVSSIWPYLAGGSYNFAESKGRESEKHLTKAFHQCILPNVDGLVYLDYYIQPFKDISTFDQWMNATQKNIEVTRSLGKQPITMFSPIYEHQSHPDLVLKPLSYPLMMNCISFIRLMDAHVAIWGFVPRQGSLVKSQDGGDFHLYDPNAQDTKWMIDALSRPNPHMGN